MTCFEATIICGNLRSVPVTTLHVPEKLINLLTKTRELVPVIHTAVTMQCIVPSCSYLFLLSPGQVFLSSLQKEEGGEGREERDGTRSKGERERERGGGGRRGERGEKRVGGMTFNRRSKVYNSQSL